MDTDRTVKRPPADPANGFRDLALVAAVIALVVVAAYCVGNGSGW